jgi:hypothetical protein
VATSSFTLPLAVIVAALSAVAQGIYTLHFWLGFVCYLAIAYALVELNNANALLRVRSRLSTSLFLLFLAASPYLFPFQAGTVATFSVLLAYHLLFRSYQERRAAGLTFYAFCFIGIGSSVFPQLLFLVPFYYLAMAAQLRTFTPRTFLASLLGLCLPYWFLYGYAIATGKPVDALVHFQQLFVFQPISKAAFLGLGAHRLASFAVLFWVAIISVIHFSRNSYYDKIRVRMLFNILITQEIVLLAFICLQPGHFDVLFPVLLMNSSPLIAHYFAFTNRIVTNLLFIVLLLLLATLIGYNTWVP